MINAFVSTRDPLRIGVCGSMVYLALVGSVATATRKAPTAQDFVIIPLQQ